MQDEECQGRALRSPEIQDRQRWRSRHRTPGSSPLGSGSKSRKGSMTETQKLKREFQRGGRSQACGILPRSHRITENCPLDLITGILWTLERTVPGKGRGQWSNNGRLEIKWIQVSLKEFRKGNDRDWQVLGGNTGLRISFKMGETLMYSNLHKVKNHQQQHFFFSDAAEQWANAIILSIQLI